MITTQVTFNDFWTWLKTSGSYSTKFTVKGAETIFNYLEELSDEPGTIEFDPVAWCSEYSEYANLGEFNIDYNSDNPFDSWDQVAENATVIEFGDGCAIVGEF